ncbi:MAG TPA: response regulator [Candidatus Limnocylindrales bacterium]|nr:response regulator [Candidatus Limnocylindrales bacterium]
MAIAGAKATRPILVIEDDRDVAQMLRTYLELEGYQVVVASDAGQALQRFDEIHPRVAVIDVRIPGGSGLSLARTMKARGRTGVIIFTAGMASRREATDAGADVFLLKTAPLSELGQAVRTLLHRPPPDGY